MTLEEFQDKCLPSKLKESAGSQSHFNDLCALLGHDPPSVADKVGDTFTFQREARKSAGSPGWADVWKKGCFGWEYKGKHKDLAAAYGQLVQYRGALKNPPLLVVSDMDRILVHANFPKIEGESVSWPLDPDPREMSTVTLGDGDNLEFLWKVLHLTSCSAGTSTSSRPTTSRSIPPVSLRKRRRTDRAARLWRYSEPGPPKA